MARLGFRTSRVAICCLHTALPLIAAVFCGCCCCLLKKGTTNVWQGVQQQMLFLAWGIYKWPWRSAQGPMKRGKA